MDAGDLSPRDRAGPVVAVIVVHLALGAMLLGLGGKLPSVTTQSALKTFDVREVVPPPPPPPPMRRNEPQAAARAAAPPARRAEASPIVAPKPRLVIPAPAPVAAAPLPAGGTAASQGAAAAGTGTGAGGVGTGTGGGGPGGAGAGQDDGSHPRPRFRPLDPRGFARSLVEPLPPGARVLIIFTVQLTGRISDCTVRQSSGNAMLDALVCQVATDRFRYDPARHGDGTPYVARSAYLQVF